MATESPIRILDRTDRWPTLKQHGRYRPPSAEMVIGDLGDLRLQDPRFNSHEKNDSVPSRSESAPPSMEGSIAAVDAMFSKKISISSLEDPSSSLRGDSEIDLDQKRSLNSLVSSCQHSGIIDGDLRVSRTKISLPAHIEESGDDQLLDDSRDSVSEPTIHEGELNTATINAKDNDPVDSPSGVSHSDKRMYHQQEPLIPSNNILPQQTILRESSSYQVEGSYPQINYPVISHPYGSLNHLFHYGTSSSSAAEVQPTFQSSGFSPPLFTTSASFMTPPNQYYPNMQQSGFLPTQYNMSYNYSSPYMAGYPHQGSFPNSGVSDSGNVHAYDPQSLMKFYGQLGTPMQSHYPVQYFQPGVSDMYGTMYGRFDHQTQIGGSSMTPMSSRESRKGSEVIGLSSDGPQSTYNNLNPIRGTLPSHYTSGCSTNADPLTHFSSPSIVSPANDAKSEAGINYSGGKYYGRYSHSSTGNVRRYRGFQSQNGNDMNSFSLLEELKSGKGQRFELADVAGHVYEFSVDQHGSRFIQQQLQICSVEDKASVFAEIVPHTSKLMTDVFGNYVIQKLFEYGSPEQRENLASQLEGQILTLSFQMYGCRVIQKALEVIDLEQKIRLVKELDGHVTRCVRDQNGNHVIQKCIESISLDKIDFIISSFRGQVTSLSMHPYGCRVIQRILEHCHESNAQFIIDEILDTVSELAQDQYGNYVTQHVLERGKPHERSKIIEKLAGCVVKLSQHKFASNVVEKCLDFGNSTSRDLLIKEIIGHGEKNDNLLMMMKDQYANYVIQKILRICSTDQREVLLALIRNHLTVLKKYTYGKHIVARFEQLCGEDIQDSGP